MNKRELTKDILAELAKTPDIGATAAQLAAALGLKGKDRKRLPKLLSRLVGRDMLSRTAAHRYVSRRDSPRMEGRLKWLRSGKGLIEDAESGRTIVIPAARMGQALPGDRIAVRVGSPRPGSKAAAYGDSIGSVERVIERGRMDIVGTVRHVRAQWRFTPLDPRYGSEGAVVDAKGARPGDRVVARYAERDAPGAEPLFDIVENLGSADGPSADTVSVMRQYGLSDSFPDEVLDEAERAANRFQTADAAVFGDRMDLRNRCVFTIDPAAARDFDDAVSLAPAPDDALELGVHIADVGWFVEPGSAMDAEAYRRGTSVYFPDRVVPMLPERLSNGVCSLRPNEDRLTLSVFIVFDAQGRPIRRRFARSVIRSAARLSYEQAQRIIDTAENASGTASDVPAPVARTVRDLHRLAQTLRDRRRERDVLDFDIPEPEIRLDENGGIREILMRSSDAAHDLIEDCMIAANEAVAIELRAAGIRALSRYHEAPDIVKLRMLRERLEGLGYTPGDLSKSGRLSNFLQRCKGDPLEQHLRVLALRSMKRACYSARAHGHFGLAKDQYTHFTSPIRRYPDLAVHRALYARVEAETGLAGAGNQPARALDSMALHVSATERDADQAARDLTELMIFRYLLEQARSRTPAIYRAVVVDVKRYGCFVEIADLRAQGLIRREALTERKGGGRVRRARHSGGKGVLEAGGTVYRVGLQLDVSIESVDLDRRQLTFKLADEIVRP